MEMKNILQFVARCEKLYEFFFWEIFAEMEMKKRNGKAFILTQHVSATVSFIYL